MPEGMTVQMTEKTASLTPAEWLFSSTQNWKFMVPVYQRLFTWQTPQFNRLLEDLQTHWCSVVEKTTAIQASPYYLGIITVVKRETLKGETQYVLVDGQQRLTVIAILAAMLGKKEGEQGKAFEDISKFLNYEARPEDGMALQKIVEKGTEWLNKDFETLKKELDDSHIVSDSMQAFVFHIAEHSKKWKELWEHIKSGLTLFVSILPEVYERKIELQNEYFEKMNSSGKQLEPHEILKVRICRNEGEFDEWNAVEDFTRKYMTSTLASNSYAVCLIQAIQTAPAQRKDSIPKKNSHEKWRPALIDFPMFLLHVLKVQKKIDTLPSDSHKLLEIFAGQIGNNENFLDKMKQYRKFLDEWIIHKEVLPEEQKPTTEEGFDSDDTRFKYWNVAPTVGEVVYIGNETKESQKLSQKLKQLQMTLYALEGASQPWLVEAFNTTAGNDMRTLYQALLKYLVERTSLEKLNGEYNGKTVWPDSYLTYRDDQKRASLICLDYFLWLLANSDEDGNLELKKKVFGENIPEAVTKFVPRENRSVEHFHPQTDTNSCHRGKTEDNDTNSQGWGSNIDGENISIKDIFGNLALISAGRNAEYSNFTVNEKSARIEKRVNTKSLESIKLWLMCRECDGMDARWTPAVARRHASNMAEVIRWGLHLAKDES